MWFFEKFFKKKTEEEKSLKYFEKIKGFNEKTIEELSNGKGDDE